MQGSSVQIVQEKILRQHGIKWRQLKVTMVHSWAWPQVLCFATWLVTCVVMIVVILLTWTHTLVPYDAE